jgi:hypothetical protein
VPVACFKGVQSGFVYRFIYGQGLTGNTALPAAVADAFGNPTTKLATWNGETVVPANNDGSVAQSLIGGPAPTGAPIVDCQAYNQPIDLGLYDFSKLPSLWETQARLPNLLPKGPASVETDASGWRTVPGSIVPVSFARSQDVALDGLSSLKVVVVGGNGNSDTVVASAINKQSLAQNPAGLTILRFRYAAYLHPNNNGAGQIYIGVFGYDANFNQVASGTSTAFNAVKGTWTVCSATASGFGGAVYFGIGMGIVSAVVGDIYYFDEMQISDPNLNVWVPGV